MNDFNFSVYLNINKIVLNIYMRLNFINIENVKK